MREMWHRMAAQGMYVHAGGAPWLIVEENEDERWRVVIDFGGQTAQLIARRVRELSVYSELVPFDTPWEQILARKPRAVILSGGPMSVYEDGAPHPDPGAYAAKFTGPYSHRTLGGGIGHNLPQEAPEAFAEAVVELGGSR